MPEKLDVKLKQKVASALGKKDLNDVTKLAYKKASRLGISSEAGLVLLARDLNIGTSVYQRKLPAAIQAEIRESLPSLVTPPRPSKNKTASGKTTKSKPSSSTKAGLSAMVEYLITDPVLFARCQDILLAPRNFDRPVGQATQVLENRIRTKSGLPKRFFGENLVNNAFNEQISKSLLVVQSNDDDDQRGFTQILRGFVPFYRNPTHHSLDPLSREEAIAVCAFINGLLEKVDSCTKKP